MLVVVAGKPLWGARNSICRGGDENQRVPYQAHSSGPVTDYRTSKYLSGLHLNLQWSPGLFLAFIMKKPAPKFWRRMIIFFLWKEEPKKAPCVQSGDYAGAGSLAALMILWKPNTCHSSWFWSLISMIKLPKFTKALSYGVCTQQRYYRWCAGERNS